MADNTKQFRWIVVIKENLEALFAERPDVFVAGDLFWYAVEGEPEACVAPDTLVVFGRPKGDRGSYKQWEEEGIAPQVVFEVLSPGNRATAMLKKLQFYAQHGVEEYYIYDPDDNDLVGMRRDGVQLRVQEPIDGWVSPRLGIRFDLTGDELRIFYPDGQPFLSFTELKQQRDAAQAERDAALAERDVERHAREQAQAERDTERHAREQAQTERDEAQAERDAERLAREQAEQETARMRERLQALGIDPDNPAA